jgi:transposase
MIGGQRMGKPLGMDLRHRVIAAIEGGLSTRAAAARFSIGIATAGAWARLKRKTGGICPARQGPRRRSKLDPREAFILGLIERTPDIALAEIAEQLQADRSVRAAPATIWSFLDKRRLTFKKTAHASEQERDDIRAARALWFEWRRAHDPDRLVFIDETGVSTKMARLRGRAPRGERCRAAVPHGHWKTTTFTAALRHSGLAAPMVLDGPMNGIAFLAYVRQVLVPELRPGDIVMTATSFVRAGTTSPATR